MDRIPDDSEIGQNVTYVGANGEPVLAAIIIDADPEIVEGLVDLVVWDRQTKSWVEKCNVRHRSMDDHDYDDPYWVGIRS